MRVQSTGLGKTVMVADLKRLDNMVMEYGPVMRVTMESSEPLHWTIKVYLEPADVRRALLMGLKPSVIWRALTALFFGRFGFFAGHLAKGEGPMEEVLEQGGETSNPLARLKG